MTNESTRLEQAIAESLDVKWLFEFVNVELPPHSQRIGCGTSTEKAYFCDLALNRLLHLNNADATFYLNWAVRENRGVAEEFILLLNERSSANISPQIEVCKNPFWGLNAVYLLEETISNSSLFCNETGVKSLVARLFIELYQGRFGSQSHLAESFERETEAEKTKNRTRFQKLISYLLERFGKI
jgi:hypothetical protein